MGLPSASAYSQSLPALSVLLKSSVGDPERREKFRSTILLPFVSDIGEMSVQRMTTLLSVGETDNEFTDIPDSDEFGLENDMNVINSGLKSKRSDILVISVKLFTVIGIEKVAFGQTETEPAVVTGEFSPKSSMGNAMIINRMKLFLE